MADLYLLISKKVKKYGSWLFWIIFILLIIYAWKNRFIQDDAFISFRYADNFVHGQGLVYNIGERVEGYTNFLWTMIMSIPLFLTWDMVLFSQFVGILLFGGTLYITFLCAQKLYQSLWASLMIMIALGTNFSFSSYATGGLETQLQVFLLMLSFWLFFYSIDQKHTPTKNYILASLIFALLTLTRLDSVIFVVILMIGTVMHLLTISQSRSDKLKNTLVLLLPYVSIIGAWFLWKLAYYGDILPNTYYAKFAGGGLYTTGMNYIKFFVDSYFLWPLLLCFGLGVILKLKIVKKMWFGIGIGIIALWLLYIIRIGGDFMEFRILMPILPLVFLILLYPVYKSLKLMFIPLISLLVITAFYFPFYFKYDPHYAVETIQGLQSHLYDEHWIEIGKKLGEIFPDKSVSIAVTAAGAIAFYSGLQTIDMLGLNDKYIARHGNEYVDFPGHQKVASLDYLIQRKVHLIIAHPRIIDPNITITEKDYINAFSYYVPKNRLSFEHKLVAIPMTKDYSLLTFYLTPDPTIDMLITEQKWQVISLFESNGIQ